MGTRGMLGLVVTAGAVLLAVWFFQSGDDVRRAVEGSGVVMRENVPPSEPLALSTEPRTAASESVVRESAATPTRVGLVVKVVADETRAPIADALVLALDAVGELNRARTGADGRATVSAGFKPVRVAACAAGHNTAAVEVVASEPLELVLRREGVLAGVVIVDGSLPKEPLELNLWTTEGVGDLALLEPFAEELRAERGFHDEGGLLTDARGRFELGGLDPEWSGRLGVPSVLKIRGTRPELPLQDHKFVDLRALIPELVIEATRLPTLRGRVVDAASRAPMPGLGIDAWVEFEGHNLHTPRTGCQTDENGRFAIGLQPSNSRHREGWLDPAQRAPVARIELRVLDSGNIPTTSFEFDASELADPLDVGDLAVSPSAAMYLRVVDERGAPIAGAHVAGEGKSSEATDAQGRTRLAGLPAGPLELTAAVFGYRALMTELGAGRGSELEPVELVLGAGNIIELLLVGPNGERPEGLSVRVELPADAFAGVDTQRLGQTAFVELTGPFGSRGWSAERMWMGLRPHLDGSLAVSGLRAGIEGTAQAMDAIGQIAGEQRFVTPPDGERIEVRIEVAPPDIELRGRVVDEAGAPLPGVHVTLLHAGRGRGRQTDADGRFSYEALIAGEEGVRIEAELPGRVARMLDDIRITRDTPPVEIVLATGVPFELELIEECGRPAPTTSLQVRAPGFRIESVRALGEGRFEFEKVPLVELELIVCIGGREHRFRTHVTDELARFTLPDHGALAIEHYDLEDMVARIKVPSEPDFEHTAPAADPIALQPGSYVVEPVRWELIDRTWDYVSHGTPRAVEIRPGETTRVSFAE